MGVMSEKFNELANFYENIFGLTPVTDTDGFKAYKLPNGDTIEIFDTRFETHNHFTTGPVIGFLIDGDPSRSQWAHFRGPDGNIYELKYVNDKNTQ